MVLHDIDFFMQDWLHKSGNVNLKFYLKDDKWTW